MCAMTDTKLRAAPSISTEAAKSYWVARGSVTGEEMYLSRRFGLPKMEEAGGIRPLYRINVRPRHQQMGRL